MWHAIAYCYWQAAWWEAQAERRVKIVNVALVKGLRAYALQHAAAERGLACCWEAKFNPIRKAAREFMNAPSSEATNSEEVLSTSTKSSNT